MVKVGINGLGRIGRLALRMGLAGSDVKVVAVNSRSEIEKYLPLIKYDSVYGRLDKEIEVRGKNLMIGGEKIAFFNEKKPAKICWEKAGVKVVIEATGKFKTHDDCKGHLGSGVKRVVISAPGKGVKTIVLGVNDEEFDFRSDAVISCASCTTNCLAPVVKIIDDSFGVKKGFMSAIHAYTNGQNLVDNSHKKDWRRARAAGVNIIPTTTGASAAVGEVVGRVKGKLLGMAYRVPVIAGSVVDLVVEVEKKVDIDMVNGVFKEGAEGKYKNIVEYCKDPIVSTDIIGNSHSAVFDSLLTEVAGGSLVKVVAWYDNEWGYTSRLMDLVKLAGRKR